MIVLERVRVNMRILAPSLQGIQPVDSIRGDTCHTPSKCTRSDG